MGKTKTPKYRLECKDNKGPYTLSWQGKATEKRLQDWIKSYHQSLEIGGANEHISKGLGFVPYLNSAKIVNQQTGQVVAEYKAAMFQAI